ncbi:MAG: hypothetical protein HFI33_14890 [Lachnospiraceae bacterium]|nr:hypothetical protein [Lachnospiraceae bacterium]
MHCSKCNAELPPGKVYCPACGQEVQIVPDYDPLDELVLDVREKKDKRIKEPEKRRRIPVVRPVKSFWQDGFFRRVCWMLLALVACVCVAFGSYYLVRRQNSFPYQLQAGIGCYENQELEEAIGYFRKARELQLRQGVEDERPLLYLARTYRELEETDMAVNTFQEVLELSLEEEKRLLVYEELFQTLAEGGRSGEINGVIAQCQDEELQKKLLPYQIEKPRATIQGGEYHYYVYPQLEAAYGNIYYTLDGSMPTKESALYVGRVSLKEGDNVLTAVAINEKGIVSEELFVVYQLDFNVPMEMANDNDTPKYENNSKQEEDTAHIAGEGENLGEQQEPAPGE